MSRRTFAALAAGAVLVVAACSSSGGTPSTPQPSVAPSSVPSFASAGTAATPAGSVCQETADPGAIAVTIKDFEFAPAIITARAGQVIGFTNAGFEHHNATLDAGGCATRSLATDDRDGLVFSTAGRYPFHCTVHPWMTGAITIG